jgi:hypothetical protein
MIRITQPGPGAVQLSAVDPASKPILSVLCKRTYEVLPDGRVVLAAQQQPLVQEPEFDKEKPHLLLRDSDLYPFKPLTDIVVRGHAYSGGHPSFKAAVQVDKWRKEIAVFGDRRCTLGRDGRVIFSAPAFAEKIPIRYDRAYGGLDVVAERTLGNPLSALKEFIDPSLDLSVSSPNIYPRNFTGVGYLIQATKEAVDSLVLPNLEDPIDYLSPDRLAVGSPGRWPLMPMPQAFDWVNFGTFPRLAYMGIVHDHEPALSPIAEVKRGFIAADLLTDRPLLEGVQTASHRFSNGASLGLQATPYLQGNEECWLAGLHPKKLSWRFRLPGDRPEIQTDGRNGKMNPTSAVVHTVEIEPDKSQLNIVWRGSAAALRPYSKKELETMPLLVQWR